MRPYVGGFVIGVGISWMLLWLFAMVFARSGIHPNNGFLIARSRTPSETAALNAQGEAKAQRLVVVSRRGVPVAMFVVIVGIIIAAI